MSTTTAKNTKAEGKNDLKNMTGYPAPKQLATPTDLKPDEVEKVVLAVNPLIADAFALYVKTKNFHWHLASSHFREYHKMFDQQAKDIFESIDPMAERLRKIGGTTIRSISHVTALQTISDENSDFVAADDMITELLNDNRHIAEAIRNAIEACEDNRDSVTANLLQEILDLTERRVWFLFETSQGGKNEL